MHMGVAIALFAVILFFIIIVGIGVAVSIPGMLAGLLFWLLKAGLVIAAIIVVCGLIARLFGRRL